ncbi:MAG TPA: YhbY family RNA-binding protein [Planctomycetota bacterium]|nr:YhbY family RNA-binding protein [Planctomycetota bacterium]
MLDKPRLKALRAEAHRLSPTVRVGAEGVTPGVAAALEAAFRRAELIKLQCGRAAPEAAEDAAQALATATGATVVQTVGRCFVLWREKPPEADAPPPGFDDDDVVGAARPPRTPTRRAPSKRAPSRPGGKRGPAKGGRRPGAKRPRR